MPSSIVHTLTNLTTPRICVIIATIRRARPRKPTLAPIPTVSITLVVCVRNVTWHKLTKERKKLKKKDWKTLNQPRVLKHSQVMEVLPRILKVLKGKNFEKD